MKKLRLTMAMLFTTALLISSGCEELPLPVPGEGGSEVHEANQDKDAEAEASENDDSKVEEQSITAVAN